MIKIVSDGSNHAVYSEGGEVLKNVASITIDEILPGSPITATVVFINVKLDLTSNNVLEEYFNLKPPTD